MKYQSAILSNILFLIVLSLVFSCNKENEEPEPEVYLPEITLVSPDTTHIIVGRGEAFLLSITASINAKSTTSLSSLRIMRNYNNTGFETVLDSAIAIYGYLFMLNNYTCYANDNEGIEEWKIIVDDNVGGSSSEIFTTEIVNLNPTLSFLSGEYEPGKVRIDADTTLPVGHDFVFGIYAETGSLENLDRILIQREYENVSNITVFDSSIDVSSFTIDIETFSYPNPGQEKFEVKVWDKANRSSTTSFTITTIPAAPDITTYNNKILGAQNSNTGSIFASFDGTIYMLEDAKENATNIDFMYFYEAPNHATLAAPDDTDAALIFNNPQYGLETWAMLNSTRFKLTTLSAGDFNMITSLTQLIAVAVIPTAPDQSKINNLSTGQVLAFETWDEKYGLIRIDNIIGAADGSIEITVKVQ